MQNSLFTDTIHHNELIQMHFTYHCRYTFFTISTYMQHSFTPVVYQCQVFILLHFPTLLRSIFAFNSLNAILEIKLANDWENILILLYFFPR